jgi:hypothetical protein
MMELLACQQVIHTKGQVPSTICYTDDQMTDLKHYLHKADNPIVGVDRTFNLGSFHTSAGFPIRSRQCMANGAYVCVCDLERFCSPPASPLSKIILKYHREYGVSK